MYDNYSITANFGRPPTGSFGDTNGDDEINGMDYSTLQLMLFEVLPFNPGGDVDMNGFLDGMDYSAMQLDLFGVINASPKYESSYDFLSGEDSNKLAKSNTMSTLPPALNDNFDTNPTGWINASPTNYSNIALTDDNVWTITGTSGNYSALQCKFTVVNNPADITSIGVTLNGSSNDASTLRFYAWNFNTGTWTQIGSGFSMTTSISSYNAWAAWGQVYSDYIDGSQHMFILAAMDTANTNLNVDYIRLSVAYP